MKPAMFYAIRVHTLTPYIVAVTSLQPRRFGKTHWYGRDTRYTQATNGSMDDLRGRFESQEAAAAVLDQVIAIGVDFDAKRKVLNDQVSRLYRDERAAVDGLFGS